MGFNGRNIEFDVESEQLHGRLVVVATIDTLI